MATATASLFISLLMAAAASATMMPLVMLSEEVGSPKFDYVNRTKIE